MNRSLLSLSLVLTGALLFSASSSAKIKALTLPEMVSLADGAVVGQITKREVFRVDHPIDGAELFYTNLSVEGRSLINGEPQTVQVTFRGGFIDSQNGAFNSEAPQEHEVALGQEVVVFHAWVENMGGDVSAQALLGGHGGLFTVSSNGNDEKIVLGRGVGYPVSKNVALDELDSEITRLAKN